MDTFRSMQKSQCPMAYNQRRKRSCYGCECCMSTNLNTFKKIARRRARAMVKRQDRKGFDE